MTKKAKEEPANFEVEDANEAWARFTAVAKKALTTPKEKPSTKPTDKSKA